MCVAAPILALGAAGISAVGKGIGAAQTAATYRYQARVADRNATLANEAANDATQRTRTEAQRQYRQIGQVQGQQIAAMSANGIDTSFGSALQVQRDTAMMGAEDVAQIYKSGAQQVRGYDIDAANSRAQAQGARQAATGAIVKGVFDVASTALGGASQFKKLKGP